MSAGPDLTAGARSCTAPPGGDSPPSPGAGGGDGASEGQSAASGARSGEPGEGPPAEGQRSGGAGTIEQGDNFLSVFLPPRHLLILLLLSQLQTLKEQLDQETRRRQAYFHQMLQPGV